MRDTEFLRSDQLPERTALGYLRVDDGWRTNVFHLPVRGDGDGGAYSTAADISALRRGRRATTASASGSTASPSRAGTTAAPASPARSSPTRPTGRGRSPGICESICQASVFRPLVGELPAEIRWQYRASERGWAANHALIAGVLWVLSLLHIRWMSSSAGSRRPRPAGGDRGGAVVLVDVVRALRTVRPYN